MAKLSGLKFPGGCQTLPEGFWSAVDVWVTKPHVVNKRVCGAKETGGENVDREALRFLLDDPELSRDVVSFLTGPAPPAQGHHQPWSATIRTIIPKVNCYGTSVQKEVVLRGKTGH